jgi:hypothetical protein
MLVNSAINANVSPMSHVAMGDIVAPSWWRKARELMGEAGEVVGGIFGSTFAEGLARQDDWSGDLSQHLRGDVGCR